MLFVKGSWKSLLWAVVMSNPVSLAAPLNEMPSIGFGTWHIQDNGGNVSDIVANAIQTGYRHLDCAFAYQNQNEIAVGIKQGLKRAGIKREELWITSKLWNNRHGREQHGLQETLKQLQLDYLDLFLVHWPVGNSTGADTLDYLSIWKGMEGLVGKGTRSIGVSNFSPKQLQDIMKIATIKPKVHQIEVHPYLQQSDFINSMQKDGITVTAYSPLGNTNHVYGDVVEKALPLLSNPTITSIAKSRGCTPAQVALAWNVKRKVVVIPKAAKSAHQKENIAAVDQCKLTDEDMLKIKRIDVVLRLNTSTCRQFKNACFAGLEGI